MKKLFAVVLASVLCGCCSYSELKRDMGSVKVDGRTPVASYEVANVSYSLLGLVPLSTGLTWKDGPYSDDVGSMAWFEDACSLDDNLASVRHACKVVRADDLVNVTGRVDDYWAWSCFFVKKRVVKTSCLIAKPEPK